MNFKQKLAITQRADARRSGISDAKGPEYAGQADGYKKDDADVLANFKRQGERWDIPADKVAGIYFGKHVDAIETFVRQLAKALGKEEQLALVTRGEGIISRLDDARNYIDLFECLLYEAGLHPEAIEVQDEDAADEQVSTVETTGPAAFVRKHLYGQSSSSNAWKGTLGFQNIRPRDFEVG